MKRFFVLAFALSLSACAGKARHIAVVAGRATYDAISEIHATEQRALCGQPSCANTSTQEYVKGWTLAKSQDFNQLLLPIAEAGRQLNLSLKTWLPGDPMPKDVETIVNGLAESLNAVGQGFPDGDAKVAFIGRIKTAQATALSAIAAAAQIIAATKQEN